MEAHPYHFTTLHPLTVIITDVENDSDPVADVDPDILARIVCSDLKPRKAPGLGKVYNFSRRYRALHTLGSGLYLIIKTKVCFKSFVT